jgi:hypothetical protein
MHDEKLMYGLVLKEEMLTISIKLLTEHQWILIFSIEGDFTGT